MSNPIKNYNNRDIADLLRSVAAAYTIKDENSYRFQIIAYERAADSIEHASSEIKDLWDENKLKDLAGIGPAIFSHLDELFKTGKVKHFEQTFNGLPLSMFRLLKIPGIGPKTAYKLSKILKINNPKKSIELLQSAGKKGKIRVIDGFGEESEAKILKGIEEFLGRKERILLYHAQEIAFDIIDYLEKNPFVVRADPLGSLRRKCSTVGDIDISVATKKPKEVIAYFLKYPPKQRVLESGKTTAAILLKNEHHVDLMVQPPKAYGALLQHFTGSKHHNIKLREVAIKKGLSLSEYGMRKIRKGEKMKEGTEVNVRPKGKLIEFSSEKSFYEKLGMSWIPPELREDNGEIEAALNHNLPALVDLKDIKGDLHVHSNFLIETSHDTGLSSIEEIIQKAVNLNYEYVALTEHNPSLSRHKPEEIISLLKRKKENCGHFKYTRTTKIPITVFNSLEIDIKPDGDLAIPEKGFDYLDFAIVSVHSSFGMNKDLMTKRILRALAHPKVKILGHPTGRMLNKREGYELDWDQIFDYCLRNGKILEICAWPERLDLPDFLVKEAVKKGVKMVISTDSHSVEQMGLMSFGVFVARRGWAEKKDIINTLSTKEISDILLQ